jgi:hypothetical protein
MAYRQRRQPFSPPPNLVMAAKKKSGEPTEINQIGPE